MILGLTTVHENGLVGAESSVCNKSSGYFHGSEESGSALGRTAEERSERDSSLRSPESHPTLVIPAKTGIQ